jgi:hypothetical protein
MLTANHGFLQQFFFAFKARHAGSTLLTVSDGESEFNICRFNIQKTLKKLNKKI